MNVKWNSKIENKLYNAIIIPYYNELEKLENLLSTLKFIGEKYFVIIVDNSIRNRRKASRKGEYVVKTRSRIGFGRACNVGMRFAQIIGAKNLIIVNQDSEFVNGSELTMFRLIDSLSKEDLVLPLVHDFKNSISKYLSGILDEEGVLQKLTIDEATVKYVGKAIGIPCFGIKSEFLDNIGYFDPIYFMYYEDNDLFDRVIKLGGEIYLSSEINFLHEDSLIVNKSSTVAHWKYKFRKHWCIYSEFINYLRNKKGISFRYFFSSYIQLIKPMRLKNWKGILYLLYLFLINGFRDYKIITENRSNYDLAYQFIEKDFLGYVHV